MPLGRRAADRAGGAGPAGGAVHTQAGHDGPRHWTAWCTGLPRKAALSFSAGAFSQREDRPEGPPPAAQKPRGTLFPMDG